MVSNTFARDARLSLEAIGLGLWLLSHAAGWETNVRTITKQVKAGRDKVNRILRELEELRYLRRTQERVAGGRAGAMVYEIQCTPFEDEPPGGTDELETRKRLNRQRSNNPHKKTTPKETTSQEKTTPSGGATADAAPPSLEVPSALTQEDPVAKPAGDLALFDAPEVDLRQAGKTGAQAIVAAWIDSYRKHHGGEDPLKPDIGRVARDAKGMLTRGEAGEDELSAAAIAMGQGIYVNLAMALKKLREDKRPARPGARQGMAPASPHTDPYWQEVGRRNESEWYQQLQTDDEAVEWVRQDPLVVDELCAKWPELADRLRGAA